MKTEDNKRLVRRFYEEVVNTGNVALAEHLLSPDYCEAQDGKRLSVGIEGAKAHVIGVRQTYPDLEVTIDRQIAEGEWVVSCITARGTHKGEWLGMKPTGKPVAFTGVNVDRVVDGKIVEHGQRQIRRERIWTRGFPARPEGQSPGMGFATSPAVGQPATHT